MQIKDEEMRIGDFVYLKVSPFRGLKRFKVRGKLAPMYIGPFKVINKKGLCRYLMTDNLSTGLPGARIG